MTTQSGFIPPLSQNVPIVDRNGNPTFEFMLKFNKQNALNAGIPSTSALMSDALDLIGDTKGDLLVRDTLLWTPFHAGTDGSILRTRGAGTLPSWDTISTILDTVSNTQGSVLYRGSAAWSALGPGTSGQFLKTLGTAANPAWAAVPAGVTAANPTATASSVAVNGSSANFMRADAAPAVQIGDATHFGIYKVDNVTITATLGVLSAVPPTVPTAANPTATAKDTAVNGSAPTFMRSDAAPAIQLATTGQFGLVKPDGSTVTISGGVISSAGGLSPIATDTILSNNSGSTTTPVAQSLDTIVAARGGLAAVKTGAGLTLSITGEGSTTITNIVFSNANNAVYALSKARGTVASPAVPNTGDDLGRHRFRGWVSSGPTFGVGAEIRATVRETTWSSSALGTKISYWIAKLGTTTLVDTMDVDADNGLFLGGVNVINASGQILTAALDHSLPAGANPSATASDTAVNGTSTSFMRADAAPAIQKASASQFGVAKPDGTSITSSAGVFTATGFVPLAAAFHPGYVTGRIYLPSMIAAAASLALATNLVYACPIYVGVSHTFTGIAFHVQSAGVAGTLADVGLYSNVNGQPGSLLFDAGTVSVATTGDKTVSVSMALAPGWYWAVIGVSAACNVFSAGTGPYNYQLGVSSFDGTILTRLRGPWTFSAGALPGSFPTITYDAGTAMPLMGLVA